MNDPRHEHPAEQDADQPGDPGHGADPADAESSVEAVEAVEAVEDTAAPTSPVEHTGNPVVDSVLDSLQELDRLPPADHVGLYEAAHERLRGALSDAGESPSES